MSREFLKKIVIRYLEARNYVFLQSLGQGAFGDVIAVRTPDGREVAVKIVEFDRLWYVEDTYWPWLSHPHLLPLENSLILKEFRVKLYFMPKLPSTLDDILSSENFRKDPKNFSRVKKWLIQILSALEYLHEHNLCHLDCKTDNILIDSNDNAILSDFSGLHFTVLPINRLCLRKRYRPPEYFSSEGAKNIKDEAFDLWTYGILVLNILTHDYFCRKTSNINADTLDWNKDLKPILDKVLTESKFQQLLLKTFPKCSLSSNDIQEALDFVNFIMKLDPQDRPSPTAAKLHNFLKEKIDTSTNVENRQSPRQKNWFLRIINRIFK